MKIPREYSYLRTPLDRGLVDKIGVPGRVAVALALCLGFYSNPAGAQRANRIQIGMYAPAAPFSGSADRHSYARNLASAIETETGLAASAQAFVRFSDLAKAAPDFAIINGQCISARSPGRVLAVAKIRGSATQRWALYTRSAGGFQALKGKALSHMRTGCKDREFIRNAMLRSEVEMSYFSRLEGRPTISGAVSVVSSYKKAVAVFAPVGAGQDLRKLFDAALVPTPGFVLLNRKLDATTISRVTKVVLRFSADRGIQAWDSAAAANYTAFANSMRTQVKNPWFAMPSVDRIAVDNLINTPMTKFEQPSSRDYFTVPPRAARAERTASPRPSSRGFAALATSDSSVSPTKP